MKNGPARPGSATNNHVTGIFTLSDPKNKQTGSLSRSLSLSLYGLIIYLNITPVYLFHACAKSWLILVSALCVDRDRLISNE